MMDVFIYSVTLNFFVEYVDTIVIDSFTVSLLAAVLMKLLIDVIQYLVDRVKNYFGKREGTAAKILLVLSEEAISFFRKIVNSQLIASPWRVSNRVGTGHMSLIRVRATEPTSRTGGTADGSRRTGSTGRAARS